MNFLSLQHFNVLKGIGIVAVMIGHIGNYSGLTWFTPLGGIGVALFLFCSGYGLYCSYTNSGLKNYWKKRIFGVYSTYFLIEFVTAFIYRRDIKTIVLDMLLIEPAYNFGWYMQYLFGCYIIFWLIFKFFKNEKTRLIIFFTLAISSFFVFDNLRGEQAFSFVGGILAAILIHKKNISFKYGTTIAVAFMFFSVSLLAVKQLPIVRQQHTYIITLFNLLLKSFAASGIIYLTYSIRFLNKICNLSFNFWGKISYAFYLTHGYFFFILTDNLLGNYLVNSLVLVLVSLIATYILNFIAKKFTKILYRLFPAK